MSKEHNNAGAPTLTAILSCYSPDDTVKDYQDKIRALYQGVAVDTILGENEGPDLTVIDVPAGDPNGNVYEQLCAAFYREPCGHTKAALGEAILLLHPIYDAPLDDLNLTLEACNRFLREPAEEGVWAGDIGGLEAFAQFFISVGQMRLQNNEQYRMQMAAISSAAFGYWREGDAIKPEYDTVPLRDVAKLHVLYTNNDESRPRSICNPVGEVVLGLCKVCGKGESDLAEPCTVMTARSAT